MADKKTRTMLSPGTQNVELCGVRKKGNVQHDRFLEYMHQFNNSRELDESIRKAFSMLDRDGSGYIEWNEIKYLLSVVPGSAPLVPLSDEEVEAMMDAVDTDGDGRINFSEFSNMVKLEKRPRK